MAKPNYKRAQELVQNITEELGYNCDPLELLLRVSAATDKPWDLRVECAKAALPFVHPKLSTLQVTGKDEGPIELKAIDAIRDDPESAKLAEQLAFALALGLPASRPASLLPQSEIVENA